MREPAPSRCGAAGPARGRLPSRSARRAERVQLGELRTLVVAAAASRPRSGWRYLVIRQPLVGRREPVPSRRLPSGSTRSILFRTSSTGTSSAPISCRHGRAESIILSSRSSRRRRRAGRGQQKRLLERGGKTLVRAGLGRRRRSRRCRWDEVALAVVDPNPPRPSDRCSQRAGLRPMTPPSCRRIQKGRMAECRVARERHDRRARSAHGPSGAGRVA